MKVSDALTDIAEVSVAATLQLSYQTVAKKHGYPQDVTGKRCSADHLGFAVIGYGKLGGIEWVTAQIWIWSLFILLMSKPKLMAIKPLPDLSLPCGWHRNFSHT